MATSSLEEKMSSNQWKTCLTLLLTAFLFGSIILGILAGTHVSLDNNSRTQN